jgi:hypothetical protein
VQKPFSLNERYAQYREGLLQKKELEGLIFASILEDGRRYQLRHWRQEDCGDFASWVYPRISKAVDSYHHNGASFDSFIGAVIRVSAKEYRTRTAERSRTEYAAWSARLPDLFARQCEPEYAEPPEPVKPRRQGEAPSPAPVAELRKIPRQLLILILKCYYYMSDDFLDRIAPLAGIEKEYLKQTVDKLRVLRIKRDEKLRDMRERIYCQFYRCIIYEQKLAALPKNTAAFSRMRERLEGARQRLAAMRKRLAGIRPGATNRQIAEVIGLSKGTIDASLHALRFRWNNNTNSMLQ